MSNSIDFFQSEETSMAIPSASVSIFVDGVLCTNLQPIEIVRGGPPEFSFARLRYNPAAQAEPSVIPIEEIEFEFAMGKNICICQYYNGIPPGTSAFCLPIFCGQIDKIETNLSSREVSVEIIARDFSANLKRITVFGQRLIKTDGSDMFITGFDTKFNPGGRGNAGPDTIQREGKVYTLFCSSPLQSKPWTYAEVINYLLGEYVPTGQLQIPTFGQLKALTENKIIRELDVTGLDLIEALYRCCERMGLQFKFVPRLTETGPQQAIVFYKNGRGRKVELNSQKTSEQLSISKTNIAEMQSKKEFWPVTHRYIGLGDFKQYEATFDLVKAWSPNLEDSDYDKFSPSTNPDFYMVRDVYRKWALNETGQYSNAPCNQGEAFDFSKIFQTSQFSQLSRCFLPCLSTDQMGESLGCYLQISYDYGANWSEYPGSFNILKDECGLWLSSDQLDESLWTAAQNNTLKLRITASVESDERLRCEAVDGPVDSVTPVIEHVSTEPQYKYRKVSRQSIFYQSDNDSLGTPNEVDNMDAIYESIRQAAQVSNQTIETIDIKTPIIAFDYQPGDIVSTSPDSRDLLNCRRDSRSVRWIERVQMDFKNQCTNLKIVRERKKL
jgi:hypothetical protein